MQGLSFGSHVGQPLCAPCSTCDAAGTTLTAVCTVNADAECGCRHGYSGTYPHCFPDHLSCYLAPYLAVPTRAREAGSAGGVA